MTAPDTEPVDEPEEYAIVEIFGHRRHAGRIQEVDRFGSKMLRIDVPKQPSYGLITHDPDDDGNRDEIDEDEPF